MLTRSACRLLCTRHVPQAAFAAVQARSVQAKGAPGSKLPRSQPEHSTATFAMLSLLHNAGWPNHLLWEQWQAAHPPGTVALFAHMKVTRGVACSDDMQLQVFSRVLVGAAPAQLSTLGTTAVRVARQHTVGWCQLRPRYARS
jgi:hypothetical protein